MTACRPHGGNGAAHTSGRPRARMRCLRPASLLMCLATLMSLEGLVWSQRMGAFSASPSACGLAAARGANATAAAAALLGRSVAVVEGVVVQVGAVNSDPCTERAAIVGPPGRNAPAVLAVEVLALYKGPAEFAPPDSAVAGGSRLRLVVQAIGNCTAALSLGSTWLMFLDTFQPFYDERGHTCQWVRLLNSTESGALAPSGAVREALAAAGAPARRAFAIGVPEDEGEPGAVSDTPPPQTEEPQSVLDLSGLDLSPPAEEGVVVIDVGDRDITAQIKKTPQISIFVILGTGLGLVFVAAVFIKYVHIRRERAALRQADVDHQAAMAAETAATAAAIAQSQAEAATVQRTRSDDMLDSAMADVDGIEEERGRGGSEGGSSGEGQQRGPASGAGGASSSGTAPASLEPPNNKAAAELKALPWKDFSMLFAKNKMAGNWGATASASAPVSPAGAPLAPDTSGDVAGSRSYALPSPAASVASPAAGEAAAVGVGAAVGAGAAAASAEGRDEGSAGGWMRMGTSEELPRSAASVAPRSGTTQDSSGIGAMVSASRRWRVGKQPPQPEPAQPDMPATGSATATRRGTEGSSGAGSSGGCSSSAAEPAPGQETGDSARRAQQQQQWIQQQQQWVQQQQLRVHHQAMMAQRQQQQQGGGQQALPNGQQAAMPQQAQGVVQQQQQQGGGQQALTTGWQGMQSHGVAQALSQQQQQQQAGGQRHFANGQPAMNLQGTAPLPAEKQRGVGAGNWASVSAGAWAQQQQQGQAGQQQQGQAVPVYPQSQAWMGRQLSAPQSGSFTGGVPPHPQPARGQYAQATGGSHAPVLLRQFSNGQWAMPLSPGGSTPATSTSAGLPMPFSGGQWMPQSPMAGDQHQGQQPVVVMPRGAVTPAQTAQLSPSQPVPPQSPQATMGTAKQAQKGWMPQPQAAPQAMAGQSANVLAATAAQGSAVAVSAAPSAEAAPEPSQQASGQAASSARPQQASAAWFQVGSGWQKGPNSQQQQQPQQQQGQQQQHCANGQHSMQLEGAAHGPPQPPNHHHSGGQQLFANGQPVMGPTALAANTVTQLPGASQALSTGQPGHLGPAAAPHAARTAGTGGQQGQQGTPSSQPRGQASGGTMPHMANMSDSDWLWQQQVYNFTQIQLMQWQMFQAAQQVAQQRYQPQPQPHTHQPNLTKIASAHAGAAPVRMLPGRGHAPTTGAGVVPGAQANGKPPSSAGPPLQQPPAADKRSSEHIREGSAANQKRPPSRKSSTGKLSALAERAAAILHLPTAKRSRQASLEAPDAAARAGTGPSSADGSGCGAVAQGPQSHRLSVEQEAARALAMESLPTWSEIEEGDVVVAEVEEEAPMEAQDNSPAGSESPTASVLAFSADDPDSPAMQPSRLFVAGIIGSVGAPAPPDAPPLPSSPVRVARRPTGTGTAASRLESFAPSAPASPAEEEPFPNRGPSCRTSISSSTGGLPLDTVKRLEHRFSNAPPLQQPVGAIPAPTSQLPDAHNGANPMLTPMPSDAGGNAAAAPQLQPPPGGAGVPQMTQEQMAAMMNQHMAMWMMAQQQQQPPQGSAAAQRSQKGNQKGKTPRKPAKTASKKA